MRNIMLVMSLLISSLAARAQLSPEMKWATETATNYHMRPDIVYKRANQYECKLDVIYANDTSHPRPTLINIHGGGWVGGIKEGDDLWLLPNLACGMNIVNVEYRLAPVSLAPAAVEDCRCALRWVYQNAKEYGFDLNHLIVKGGSAGGHLSLMTGMLMPEAGFDNECPGKGKLQVAAIVNYFGITDVADLLSGPDEESYAVRWLGSLRDRMELARELSPLTYVRPGLPPIFTAHGDADGTVPYSHAVRLHKALDAVGVPNELYTVKGGGHGNWTAEQNVQVVEEYFTFLKKYRVLPK